MVVGLDDILHIEADEHTAQQFPKLQLLIGAAPVWLLRGVPNWCVLASALVGAIWAPRERQETLYHDNQVHAVAARMCLRVVRLLLECARLALVMRFPPC